MNRKSLTLIMLLTMAFLALPAQKGHLDRENLTAAYAIDNSMKPYYKIFHINDSLTLVYYQFNFKDFTYLPTADSAHHYAKYMLSYSLYESYKGKKLLDSASVLYYDTANYGRDNSSIGYFNIKVAYGALNILKVSLFDANAESEVVNLIEVDKTNRLNRQNFYLLASDGLPILTPWVARGSTALVVFNNIKAKHLKVKHFNPALRPATPPMSDNPMKKVSYIRHDSAWHVELHRGKSDEIHFDKQGIYHFYPDSGSSTGFSVFVFTSGYPYITTGMQMVAPLRYVTSAKEFKALLRSRDKKRAAENFWERQSSGKKSADDLIFRYYNRVQQANVLFGSMKEGWMTDRGMVYIIYGPPESVYRNSGIETWLYGRSKSSISVKFDFLQADNPFTKRDYRLNRSPNYINSWNNAIELWRR